MGIMGVMGVMGAVLSGCVMVPRATVKGTICGQPFAVSSPKDSELEGLEISADTNGVVRIHVQRLKTRMNPDVVRITAEGQAAIINATAEAVARGMAAGASAAAK